MEAILWEEMKRHYKDFWNADMDGKGEEAMLAIARFHAVKRIAGILIGVLEGDDIAKDAESSARYECAKERDKNINMKVVLKRDKKTGNYHWKDFEISKGMISWNVYRWNKRFDCFIDYKFSAATLAEVRISLADYE